MMPDKRELNTIHHDSKEWNLNVTDDGTKAGEFIRHTL
jgi:hypothetical protein